MKGMIAVNGMALASAHLILEQDVNTEIKMITDVDDELTRLNCAKEKCIESLSVLMEKLESDTDAQSAEILDFQLLLLEDVNYFGQISQMIEKEKVNCEYAVAARSASYREELAALDNPYLNERAADITDLEKRLLRSLNGREESEITAGEKIVIAQDLTPSQLVELRQKQLKGIILEKGGMSSHCVILARSMGIPCFIHAENVMSKIREGELVLLDCVEGKVIASPDKSCILKFEKYRALKENEALELQQYRSRKAITKDGREMKVYANISSKSEVEELLLEGAEGIGLMRTEMLYMESSTPPEEEEQYRIYSDIAQSMEGRPLIIRTLDAGGDKKISYLNIPEEDNPFLGYRAIRYCLDNRDIFKAQISAVLRAGKNGNVQLMIPMVSAITEVLQVKELIKEVENELKASGTAYGKVSVGMMVETPAAALMADRFAEVVDFFSIGTNDLTQYLFAADRNNAQVAGLNSYYQPALLRTMKYICECAGRNEIEVDICGQAGEVDDLIPLWIGMGIDNLSVSIPSITRVRRRICQCSLEKCIKLLDAVLKFNSDEEVHNYIKKEMEQW